MRERVILALGVIALTILVTLLVWQGSFTFGDYAPKNPEQTFVFWAISTLVALLTIVVGFMLFRTAVKLYIERQTNKPGSRIRTKLIIGALALSCVPVLFLVLFGYGVMNLIMTVTPLAMVACQHPFSDVQPAQAVADLRFVRFPNRVIAFPDAFDDPLLF